MKIEYDDYGKIIEVPTLSERISNWKEKIKLEWVTSSHYRNKAIKNITKIIEKDKITSQDSEAINAINEIVVSLDLTDGRYGKTLDSEVLEKFNKLKEENAKFIKASNKDNKEITI